MFFLYSPDAHRDLHSFPTRRSSDLGIRASHAVQAVAAETFGRPQVLADAIASFAAADDRIKVWNDFRLVDEVARGVVTFSSDKHWTASYGHRTPNSYFGKMSPERSTENVETMDLDGLL